MKKLISIMLSAALICSMVSCGKDSSDDKKNEIVPLELIKETVTETEYDGDILIYTVSYEAVRLSDADAENYPQLAAELESIIEADAEIIGYAKENMKDQYLGIGFQDHQDQMLP